MRKSRYLNFIFILIILPFFSSCRPKKKFEKKGIEKNKEWILIHTIPRIKQGQDKIKINLYAKGINEKDLKLLIVFENGDKKEVPLLKEKENNFYAEIDAGGPGEKINYAFKVKLPSGKETRFPQTGYLTIVCKGKVNKLILIAHVGAMFIALLLLLIGGWKCAFYLIKKQGIFSASKYIKAATITMFIGGIPLGMIVEKSVFGTWWEGWPFGRDVTDTKTSVILAVWVLLTWKRPLPGEKDEEGAKKWARFVLGMILFTIFVYLIPHENIKF